MNETAIRERIRNKHRLPNHFGSIKYLGPGRKNAYGVYPPKSAEARDQKAISYVEDWVTGYQVLVLYHAGVYRRGMEQELRNKLQGTKKTQEKGMQSAEEDGEEINEQLISYARKVLQDIENIRAGKPIVSPIVQEVFNKEEHHEEQKTAKTFSEVYESLYEHTFGPHAQRKLKDETKNAYWSAWMKLKLIWKRTLDDVDIDELETIVNRVADNDYSKTTVTRVVTLIRKLYRYAYHRGYCTSMHGMSVQMPAAKEETHHPDFTDDDLARLWEVYENGSTDVDKIAGANKKEDVCKELNTDERKERNLPRREKKDSVRNIARMLLIMCYSGFRIGEYETLETVLDGPVPYFKGGLKTAAGKNRIVPIHSAILPLVKEIVINGKPVFLCGKKHGQFRRDMRSALQMIGIDQSEENTNKHYTPHSTRHTFSRLCESYDVREADRKRMLGHSLRNDVTNSVYGHRSIAELSAEIEKIQLPGQMTTSERKG